MSNSSRLCAALPQYRGRPSQSGDKYIFFQVFTTGKSVQRYTKSASFLRARSSQEKRVPKIYEMYKFLCFFPPGLRNPTLCYQRIYDLIAGERKPGTSPFFPTRELLKGPNDAFRGYFCVCRVRARSASPWSKDCAFNPRRVETVMSSMQDYVVRALECLNSGRKLS